MEDEELTKAFNKAQEEWKNKVHTNPSYARQKLIAENKVEQFKIDPYKKDTIEIYLRGYSEEEKNDRIKQLFNFIIREYDEFALEKVIDYLAESLAKKKKTLEAVANRIKRKIDAEDNKVEETQGVAIKIDNYQDNIESYYKNKPFFYDENKIFWKWNFVETKWEIKDEVDLMIDVDKILGFCGQSISSGIRSNYIEALKRVGREKKPQDSPKRWIQFKNKAFSLRSGNVYDVKPNYFFCNPIPWELGKSDETPTIDKLLTEWVGKKYVKTLYEIIAYCCYQDYPIQVLFCLYGIGRNGKTCFLRLLSKFLGKDNLCSTDLDLLMGNNRSRFETFKLYKKLMCLMGETNFGILSSSAMLKKLTGGDMIGYEVKGGKTFDDYSYAKLIIASNSLPTSEDTSEGFYRRWVIIDFPNQFPEGKDIIKSIPTQEYEALALKITRILPKLIERGSFTNQGDVEERRKKYIMASNPLPYFIEQACIIDPQGAIRYSAFYSKYCSFLDKQRRRIVSRREFSKLLNIEGFENRKTSKEGEVDYYVEGIKFKEDLPDFLDFHKIHTSSLRKESSIEFTENEENEEKLILSSKKDILNYVISTPLCSLENIKEASNLKNDEILAILEKLKQNFEIFEPKPNKYKSL